MRREFTRLAVAIVSVVAFGGCSSHRQLATQAVGFNLAVEKAQNEMLLLNVIRARDRLPMYMTGISSLSGNVQTSLSTSLGASYSQAKGRTPALLDTLAHGLTASAGGTLSTNPTFNLAVLDTQEFMRGFLAPIDKATLAYYWNQGWPHELLLYLLVQRVEIGENGSTAPPQVFSNHPDSDDPNLAEMVSFGGWLHDFLARKPQLAELAVIESLGPRLSRDEVSDVANLVLIAKEGLLIHRIDSDPELYQLQRQRMDLQFKLEAKPASEGRSSDAKSDPVSRQKYDHSLLEEKGKVGTLDGSTTITFVLRSPEALVYYLGELMRAANRKDSPKVPYACIQGHFQPIFVALPTNLCEDTLLDADSGRGRYSIPPATPTAAAVCEQGEIRLGDAKCEGGRSMQALRLVSQIISLQKSAKDMPSTAFVRLIE